MCIKRTRFRKQLLTFLPLQHHSQVERGMTGDLWLTTPTAEGLLKLQVKYLFHIFLTFILCVFYLFFTVILSITIINAL